MLSAALGDSACVPLKSFESKDGALYCAFGCFLPSAAASFTVIPGMRKAECYLPSRRAGCGIILSYPSSDASPDDIYLLADSDYRAVRFSLSDYKNTRGHIAVVGGSDRYTGAPRLAARAAFFAGAGLVTIVTDSERIRDSNPAVIIAPPSSDLSGYDAIAMGPGWGEGSPCGFRSAVSSGRNMVIDADALRFVPSHRFSHRAVLTPHLGEYRRLMADLSMDPGLDSARSLSASLRALASAAECVVVLKSSAVWITDGGTVYVYDGANPSLGVAGSGDVLSGIIAALMGAGEEPLRAAIDGVILHQRAGRKAMEDYGFYSAEELILEVGKAR